jgi:hypothetical protein
MSTGQEWERPEFQALNGKKAITFEIPRLNAANDLSFSTFTTITNDGLQLSYSGCYSTTSLSASVSTTASA